MLLSSFSYMTYTCVNQLHCEKKKKHHVEHVLLNHKGIVLKEFSLSFHNGTSAEQNLKVCETPA